MSLGFVASWKLSRTDYIRRVLLETSKNFRGIVCIIEHNILNNIDTDNSYNTNVI